MKTISRNELKKALNEITLIDVSDARVYGEKHIPGAVNVPWDAEFLKTVAPALRDKDAKIVVYGAEAAAACKKLESSGYAKVSHYAGGLMDWMSAGWKVEFGNES